MQGIYRVRGSCDGHACLAIGAGCPFRRVCADSMMLSLRVTGFHLEALLLNAPLRGIPIIKLSNSDKRSERSVCQGCEPNSFLRKRMEWKTAMAILDSPAGVSIDTVMCNAALDAYSRMGKWFWASTLFQKMCSVRSSVVEPDEISSSTLLAACETASLWKPQLDILRLLTARSRFWCFLSYCVPLAFHLEHHKFSGT